MSGEQGQLQREDELLGFSRVIRALREVDTKYRSGLAKREMSHLSKKKI